MFDPQPVHTLLDQAAEAFAAMVGDRVPDEAHRFGAFLNTLRMITDQAADSASKEATE